ncbi:acyl-CoA dehydrogenase family protein [Rhodococcus sp. IEGM1428]|uniref:acyl-CoA dehydrogenase family protein n=1 Tax=Rhodococcus sp. IEGM1428 TaxID=3392191 RepID=UPI003D11E06E
MDLIFTDEQDALRHMVRQMVDKGNFDATRLMEQSDAGFDPQLWRQFADAGLTGMALPADMGGDGMSLLDAVVVFEEMGRALVPSPLFASVGICAEAILQAGSNEQKAHWLPQIASGEAIVVPAWLEADGGYGEGGVTLAAVPHGDSWRLTGDKWHVPFAASAQALVVVARAEQGWTLFLVDPGQSGVSIESQTSLARDSQSIVSFDSATGELLGTIGGAWGLWHDVMNRAAIFAAAQASGGSRRVLEITVEHAKTRHQFGKPLGAFQAVSHYLADGVTEIDAAQALVWQAAWVADNGQSIRRLAPMAKLSACNVFRDISAISLQICGGLGFTTDFDAQLFFRRAKQWQLSWWDTTYLEDLIAADALDSVS